MKVRIVMFVWTDENKRKRGRDGPFLKTASMNVSGFIVPQTGWLAQFCSLINVIYMDLKSG